MDDLDKMLACLAHAPLPATLDSLEARVFDHLSVATTSRAGVGVGLLTIVGALAMGMASAVLPAAPAAARSPLSLFGPGSALAPSTLLVGTP